MKVKHILSTISIGPSLFCSTRRISTRRISTHYGTESNKSNKETRLLCLNWFKGILSAPAEHLMLWT